MIVVRILMKKQCASRHDVCLTVVRFFFTKEHCVLAGMAEEQCVLALVAGMIFV